jgi:hypothetical protein
MIINLKVTRKWGVSSVAEGHGFGKISRYGLNGRVRYDSHIPCRSAKGLDCVFPF